MAQSAAPLRWHHRGIRVDRESQGRETFGKARARARDDRVVDGLDHALADGSHRGPARAAHDSVRADAVGRVAQDDYLRILGHESLERDAEDGRVRRGDRVASGQLDHVGDERIRRRAEDLGLVANLVENARPVEAGDGARDFAHAPGHAGDHVLGGLVGPDRLTDERDVRQHALDARRVDDENWHAQIAQSLEIGRWIEVVAAG